jgi:myosin heavy subunit
LDEFSEQVPVLSQGVVQRECAKVLREVKDWVTDTKAVVDEAQAQAKRAVVDAEVARSEVDKAIRVSLQASESVETAHHGIARAEAAHARTEEDLRGLQKKVVSLGESVLGRVDALEGAMPRKADAERVMSALREATKPLASREEVDSALRRKASREKVKEALSSMQTFLAGRIDSAEASLLGLSKEVSAAIELVRSEESLTTEAREINHHEQIQSLGEKLQLQAADLGALRAQLAERSEHDKAALREELHLRFMTEERVATLIKHAHEDVLGSVQAVERRLSSQVEQARTAAERASESALEATSAASVAASRMGASRVRDVSSATEVAATALQKAEEALAVARSLSAQSSKAPGLADAMERVAGDTKALKTRTDSLETQLEALQRQWISARRNLMDVADAAVDATSRAEKSVELTASALRTPSPSRRFSPSASEPEGLRFRVDQLERSVHAASEVARGVDSQVRRALADMSKTTVEALTRRIDRLETHQTSMSHRIPRDASVDIDLLEQRVHQVEQRVELLDTRLTDSTSRALKQGEQAHTQALSAVDALVSLRGSVERLEASHHSLYGAFKTLEGSRNPSSRESSRSRLLYSTSSTPQRGPLPPSPGSEAATPLEPRARRS